MFYMFRGIKRSTKVFKYPSKEVRDRALSVLNPKFPDTLFFSQDEDKIVRQNSGSVNYDMTVAKMMEELGGMVC
jgi:hypothetical protein